MTTIDFRDISVVVQGPIVGGPDDSNDVRLTHRCVESIRRHLSGAEIIISTWEGSNLIGLSHDIAVFSTDPGGCIFHKDKKYFNNINRQLVSTLAGLRVASKKYCIKIRSDMELTGSDFLKYFGVFLARNEELSFLKERVLVSTVYSRNPHRNLPFAFHPSDWFCFGYLEDVLDMWDVPLADEPGMSRYFEFNDRPNPDFFPHFLNKYFPEQYLWVNFLRKHVQVDFDFFADKRNSVLDFSEKSLSANLVLLDPKKLNVKFLKYNVNLEDRISLYTHWEWQKLYKKYCDTQFNCAMDSEVIVIYCLRLLRIFTIKGILSITLAIMTILSPSILVDWEGRFPKSFIKCRNVFRFFTNAK